MRPILALTTIVVVLCIIIIVKLLLRIYYLDKKLKYVDEANMWHKLAVTDDLTGIHNRNAYNLRIKEMRGCNVKKSPGIIVFDVDNFKMINDTKGHLAGDEVLKKVAKILLDIFPEPKYRVFRIGGDEFSVLSENVSENEIIKRLLALQKCLAANGNIGLSKGYSIVGDNPDEAFKCADEMLYADKLSKKCNKHIS